MGGGGRYTLSALTMTKYKINTYIKIKQQHIVCEQRTAHEECDIGK